MEKLLTYAYPGNVRELENILERAVTLCSDGRVEPGDIQLKLGTAAVELPPVEETAEAAGLEGQLESIEREAIVRALEQTQIQQDQGGGSCWG